MNLGRKIKIARVAAGLTQEQLAQKIHKTRPLVSMIEKTGKANPQTLRKITEVLNIKDNSALFYDFSVQQAPRMEEAEMLPPVLTMDVYQQLRKEIDFLRMLIRQQQDTIRILTESEKKK